MADSFESDSEPDVKSISKQKSTAGQGSLDEAIEHCVGQLESNPDFDIEELVASFPQWSAELAEFVENWSGMEHFANVLSETDSVDSVEFPNDDARRFGNYELIEKIGAGGMGVIYKAHHVSLDRIVAIKMVSRQHRDRDRFRVEAEAAASLTHANIVPIYEIGEESNRLFFSMRLIEGGSLRDFIDEGAVAPREVARIVATVARAVGFAHQHGILHRDLKPANVLMDVDRQPHISDFGLAKQISRDTEITRTGTIMGTPGYMAPEQAAGKTGDLTTATDIYGVGAILYALLTGQPPFTGESSLEVLRRVIDESPTSPRNIRRTIPRDLETICLKCLSKESSSRYHTADLLADDLERYLNNQPVRARPISTSERFWRWCRRNPAIALLSGAVVLLLLTTTVSSFFLALSERNARLQTEVNGKRETHLRARADDAALRQAKSAEVAIQAQAELCLTNGLWQAKQDNHGEAVLWFAEAARRTQNDSKKLSENRLRYQSWIDQQPTPIGAMLMEDGYREMANLREQGAIQFRRNSTQLLCRAGSQFVVWDHVSDKRWNLHEEYPGLTAAKWSENGRLLVTGDENGMVKIVHGDSQTVRWEFEVGDKVEHLAFSFDNQLLAVATKNTVEFWNVRNQKLLEQEAEFENQIAWIGFGESSHHFVAVEQVAKYKGAAYAYEVDESSINLKFEFACRADRTTESRSAFRPKFVANDRFLAVRANNERPERMEWIDTESGQVKRSFVLDSHTFAVDISKNGEHMVAGDEKNAVVRWFLKDVDATESIENSSDVESRDSNRTNQGSENHRTSTIKHTDRVSTVAINDDLLVATGGWDSVVQLWTFEDYLYGASATQRLRRLATLSHQTRVRHVRFSPDGSRLVTAQADGLIRVWKLPSGTSRKQSVPVPTSGSLARIVDRQHWMISGMPRTPGAISNASVFDIESGEIVGGTNNLSKEVHGSIMNSCAMPDENLVITTHANPNRSQTTYQNRDGTSGSIRFWNMSDGQPLGKSLPLHSEPRWIDKHPSGDHVAVCLANMDVVIVNPHAMDVENILLPLNGSESVSQTSTAELENLETRSTPKGSLHPTHRCNQQLSYSPDGKLLAVWSAKQVGLWVWEVETGQLCFAQVDNAKQPINRVEFSSNSKLLAVAGGRNNTANVLNAWTGANVIPALKDTSAIYHTRFSSDCSKVVVACRDGTARVLNVSTGEVQSNNMSHPSDIVDAAFTPDDKFVLTLGFDQLRVWHTGDGSLAMKPISIPNRSRQMHITFDSRFVIIAGGQSEVVVFDLELLQKIDEISVNQMQQTSELLSSKTISKGTITNMSTREWFDRWNTQNQRKATSD